MKPVGYTSVKIEPLRPILTLSRRRSGIKLAPVLFHAGQLSPRTTVFFLPPRKRFDVGYQAPYEDL